LQISLGGGLYDVNGLRYLPRQDGGDNGRISQYAIYVSTDGANWGTAVASGTFADTADEQEVLFAPVLATHVRLVALGSYDGDPWTSVAELNVLGDVSSVNPIDTDNDGIFDDQDNCILIPNGPLIPNAGDNSQRDTDGDGYGNMCDADLINTDGLNTVNLSDYSQFRGVFGTSAPGVAPYSLSDHADFNGDGVVNLSDYSIFRASFGKAPGPSCCAISQP
jgi:hypothetical protein